MSLVQDLKDQWRVRRALTTESWLVRLERARLRWKFDARKRTNFYQALSNQVASGISIKAALETRYLIYSDGGKNKRMPLAIIVAAMKSVVTVDGSNIAKAIAPWSSPTEVAVVAAAEKAGNDALVQCFARLVDTMERRNKLIKAAYTPLKAAAFFIAIDVGTLLGLSLYWAPMTRQMTPANKIAPLTQILLGICDFTVSYGGLVALGLLVLAVFIGKTLDYFDRTSSFGQLLERLPPWSIYRVFQNAQFLFNIGDLFANDTPQPTAMQILADNGGNWVRTRVLAIKEQLQKNGDKFGKALLDNPYDFPDRETAYFMADVASVVDKKKAIDTFANRELETRVEAIGSAARVATVIALLFSAAWWGFEFAAAMSKLVNGLDSFGH